MKLKGVHKSIITNAGALAVGGVVAQIAYLSLEGLIARKIGSASYGVYSSSYVFIMIMVHLMDMGMYWKLIQDGSRDPRAIGANLGTMMVMRIALFFLIYPIFLATMWFLDHNVAAVEFFALFALFGLNLGIHDLLASVYVARQRMGLNALFQSLVPVMVLLFVFFFVYKNPSMIRLALAFLIGSSLVTLVWAYLIWEQEKPKFQLLDVKRIFQGSWHYGVTGLVWNVYLRLGVLILTFLSTIEQVAFFAAGFKLVDLVFKFSVLANRVIAPRLFADSEGNSAAFVRSINVVMRLALGGGSLGFVLLYVCSGQIIHLVYGQGFFASVNILQILGAAMALKTVSLIVQTIVSAAGDHTARTRSVSIVAAFVIGISVPMVWYLGAKGMAYSVLLGDLLLMGLLTLRVRGISKDLSIFSIIFGPLLATTVSLIFLYFVSLGWVINALVCLSVFAAIFVCLGYFRTVISLVMKPGPAG